MNISKFLEGFFKIMLIIVLSPIRVIFRTNFTVISFKAAMSFT